MLIWTAAAIWAGQRTRARAFVCFFPSCRPLLFPFPFLSPSPHLRPSLAQLGSTQRLALVGTESLVEELCGCKFVRRRATVHGFEVDQSDRDSESDIL